MTSFKSHLNHTPNWLIMITKIYVKSPKRYPSFIMTLGREMIPVPMMVFMMVVTESMKSNWDKWMNTGFSGFGNIRWYNALLWTFVATKFMGLDIIFFLISDVERILTVREEPLYFAWGFGHWLVFSYRRFSDLTQSL